jgi:predicted DCC family thiol-disulfide oxidoreductase YuxK
MLVSPLDKTYIYHMNKHEHILLFDGVCNLCNGLVQFIIKRDKKAIFTFASLQSEYGQSVLRKYGLPQTEYNSLVYLRNNTLYLKSSASLLILKDLKGIWSIFYIFIGVPKFLRDPIYTFISRNRYRFFGKRDVCMIPTLEIQNRFIE